MGMKKLVSRTKKTDGAKPSTHSKRARITVAIIGGVIGVTGAVAASIFAASGTPAPAATASTAASTQKPSSASSLSPQRAAENRRAQAELASSRADYAAGTTGTTNAPPVTLTGCLEQKGDEFRLKNASGIDAPKSRSWKTGFLTHHTPAIDIVDASHKLKLTDHVGQRVSITGTLVDKEMQARTLKNVSASCE